MRGGEIINRFETLVKVKSVPDYIAELTGITYEDTLNAPSAHEALQELRIFLGNSVFVSSQR